MTYEKMKEYFKDNILIDDDTLLDYIKLRVNEEKVNDLISYINITNYGDSCYDPQDGSLSINSEEIFLNNIDDKIPDLLKLVRKKDKARFKLCNPNCGNIYNIHLINHEINHLIQKKVMIENNDKLKCVLFWFGKCEEFIDDRFFKSFYYLKYHDRFYNEYNANINGYYELLKLLNSFNLENIEKDLFKVNRLTSKHILYLYSDLDKLYKYSTPLKNSLKIYKHLLETCKKHEAEIEIDKNFIDIIKKEQPETQLDKLLYGYSIDIVTHNYLKDVANGKVKTLNLFNDISC